MSWVLPTPQRMSPALHPLRCPALPLPALPLPALFGARLLRAEP